MNKSLFCLSIAVIALLPTLSFAGAVITYHGRIMDPADRPVEGSGVTFRIRVYSPSPGKCLLYEETRTLNMTGSSGVFTIPIGDGGGTRTVADPGVVMEKIFSNDPNLTHSGVVNPKVTCNSGNSYTPQTLDQRQLAVSFDDASGAGEQFLPMMDVNFVPFAVSSYDAQNIGGTAANSVVRVNGGNASPLTPANFAELLNLLSGTSAQYSKANQLNGTNVPTLTNGQVLGWSGSGWTAMTPSTDFSLPNTGSAGTYYKVTTDAKGRVTSGSASLVESDIPTLSAAGKVSGSAITSGTIGGTTSISTSGTVSADQISTRGLYLSNAQPRTISVLPPASITPGGGYSLTLPQDVGASGALLTTSGSGVLTWTNPSSIIPAEKWATNANGIDYSSGNVGIGTVLPTSNLSFSGQSSQVIAQERTTGGVAGSNLTIMAAGATAGGTDLDGGDLILSGGIATGTGRSQIKFQLPTTLNTSGTIDRALATKMTLDTHLNTGSGMLGINVAAPTTTLDINSANVTSVTSVPLILRTGSNVGNYNGFNLVAHGTQSASALVTSGGFYTRITQSSPLKSELSIYNNTGNTQNIFLFASDIGNVGIGTTNPQSKLDVAGVIRATDICDENGANCKDISAGWGGGGSGTVASVTAGAGLETSPGAGISTTGSIGIADSGVTTTKINNGAVTGAKLETLAGLSAATYGTATAIPAVTVDTKGRITAITTNSITGLLPTATGVSGKYLKSDGTNWSGQDIKFNDIKNAIGASAFDLTGCAANQTVAWSSLTDMFQCQAIGSLSASAITSGTIDAARLPAGASMWQDGGAGKIYYNSGNVGIGTAAPTAALDVNALQTIDGLTSNIISRSTGTATGMQLVASGGKSAIQSNAGDLVFWSDNQTSGNNWIAADEKMRITTAGNVGIGTTNPNTLLEIKGDNSFPVRIDRNNATQRKAFLDFAQQGTKTFGIGVDQGGTNANNFSVWDYVAGVSRFIIDSSGNIGIGTTAPAYKLSVEKVAGGDNVLLALGDTSSASSGKKLTIGYDYTGGVNAGKIQAADLGVGWTNLLLNPNGGNVGIGTSSPSQKLDVLGGKVASTRDSNQFLTMYGGDATNQDPTISAQSSFTNKRPLVIQAVNNNMGGGSGANDILFKVGDASTPTTVMKILEGGDVGIGTATPVTKLHVEGAISTTDTGVGIRGIMYANPGGGFTSYGSVTNHDTVMITNNTERMRIKNSGNIGVGITNPSEKLHVFGNLRVQGSTDCTLGNGAGGTNCSSDIRLKTNVHEIKNPLEKILELRGVDFDWNEKSQSPGQHAIGVIAQDVEKQFPTAVIDDSTTGYKKVDYAVLVAPIIGAIKELNFQIQEFLNLSSDHSRQLALLEGENTMHKKKIQALQDETITKSQMLKAVLSDNQNLKDRLDELERRFLKLEQRK